MAYNWNWDNKAGKFFFNGGEYNFYIGNGFMIVLNEWEEDGAEKYQVAWFFVDKQHAKDCLGLTNGHYDMFEGNVDKIVIFKEHCSNWKDIVELFTKSQKDIAIEIYNTEEAYENAHRKEEVV